MQRTDRELLQAALNALYQSVVIRKDPSEELMAEIRARLAQPEGEPFMWFGYTYVNDQPMERCQPFQLMVDDIPLYRHPRQPVRLSDEKILTVAEKYGTSSTRHKPTYHLWDGSPTGEPYPQTDWDFGQDDLLGFARELLEKTG